MSETVPIDALPGHGAAFILTFPGLDEEEAGRRLNELRSLGVDAIELRGRHAVRGYPIMGKGHVGIVIAARVGGHPVALKVRRMDADRESLEYEAERLRVANGVSVGPRLLGVSRNFLLMELVEGSYLSDWLKDREGDEPERVRALLAGLLSKTRRLDEAGLDHGELSRATRHVIVDGGEARVVDFESASTARRCANVTSIVQFLFFNKQMRALVGRVLPLPDGERLISSLRRYRREPGEASFAGVLEECGLSA